MFFVAYFLEDAIELLDFDPSAESRKRKKNKKNDEDAETAVDDDDNMNKYVSNEYTDLTKNRVAALSEKDISFELIEASIKLRSIFESCASINVNYKTFMICFHHRAYLNTLRANRLVVLCWFFCLVGILFLPCCDISVNIKYSVSFLFICNYLDRAL